LERLKLRHDQTTAKVNMVYTIREGRHVGLALGLDSLRFLSIDIDVRTLTDFLFLKSMGIQGLSSDLRWLYSIFNPFVVASMPPQNFIIVSKSGPVGAGVFSEVPWHKKESEDIVKELGIEVEYGEPVSKGLDKGKFMTVGDEEHASLIKSYIEEGVGMGKPADRIGRPSKTVHDAVLKHDELIDKTGCCTICQRVKSEYASVRAMRTATANMQG